MALHDLGSEGAFPASHLGEFLIAMPVLKIGWLRWWYSLNISLKPLCTPNFLKFGKKRIPVPIRQDDLKGKRGLFFVKHWGFCSPRITIAGHHLSRIMMSIGSYGSLKFKKKQYFFCRECIIPNLLVFVIYDFSKLVRIYSCIYTADI